MAAVAAAAAASVNDRLQEFRLLLRSASISLSCLCICSALCVYLSIYLSVCLPYLSVPLQVDMSEFAKADGALTCCSLLLH